MASMRLAIWVCALCMCGCVGVGAADECDAHGPAFESGEDVAADVRTAQHDVDISFKRAGEWAPLMRHPYYQPWQLRYMYPGVWDAALAAMWADAEHGTTSILWNAYSTGTFRGIADTRENAYKDKPKHDAYFVTMISDMQNGMGMDEQYKTAPNEPRDYLSGDTATYLTRIGLALASDEELAPRRQEALAALGQTRSTTTTVYFPFVCHGTGTRATVMLSGTQTVHSTRSLARVVILPQAPDSVFYAPFVVASRGRSVLLQHLPQYATVMQRRVCHDGTFAQPGSGITALYPGTPLVRHIAPEVVKHVTLQDTPLPDAAVRTKPEHFYNSHNILYNWFGYSVSFTETVLFTCICSNPIYTFGPGCRHLVCDGDRGDEGIPPDQFWPYCVHTLRRMCTTRASGRHACGPAYDAEGLPRGNWSARGVHNPFTNTWSCSCDTPFWDAYPGAVGFALDEASPGAGLVGEEEPVCVGGPPCTVMAYCADHVDAAAGFDPITHLPVQRVNYVGEHAAEMRMCNGHGTCGHNGAVFGRTPGSQIAGTCSCDDRYRGPGCSQCDTAAGWWGFDSGCTDSCLSRGLVCHDKGTCDSFVGCVCHEAYHRDPTTNCQTCLPGYVVDPSTCPIITEGVVDLEHPDCWCVASTQCMDAASEQTCAGHGTCISTTFHPRLTQQCVCDDGWSGTTCALEASHCATTPTGRPCAFPRAFKQCKRTRLFLWPPDPSAIVDDVLWNMPLEAWDAAWELAGVDLGMMAETPESFLTVAEAWPHSLALNQALCRFGSGWSGAAVATPADWERASPYTRGGVVVAMRNAPTHLNMVLGSPESPGGQLTYASLANGRLVPVNASRDVSPGTFAGPALCIRDSCQLDEEDCTAQTLDPVCTPGPAVRVVSVAGTSITADAAVAACGRYSMMPLRREDIRDTGYGFSDTTHDFKRAYEEAVEATLGPGGVFRSMSVDEHTAWGTVRVFTNRMAIFATSALRPDGSLLSVDATCVHTFEYAPRNEARLQRAYGRESTYVDSRDPDTGAITALQCPTGHCFVPCSRTCVFQTVWGPDPDCTTTMGNF